jgi:hypothetical protein
MQKTPSRPVPSKASLEVLATHYNSQVNSYNARLLSREKSPHSSEDLQTIITLDANHNSMTADTLEKLRAELIELIRRQNRKLGKTIRHRALVLLEERIKGLDGLPMRDEDGRSVGLKYIEVLDIIRAEFPEASTSVACLRWYIVHLKIDANDQGLPWPDLPQKRPRSITKKA